MLNIEGNLLQHYHNLLYNYAYIFVYLFIHNVYLYTHRHLHVKFCAYRCTGVFFACTRTYMWIHNMCAQGGAVQMTSGTPCPSDASVDVTSALHLVVLVAKCCEQASKDSWSKDMPSNRFLGFVGCLLVVCPQMMVLSRPCLLVGWAAADLYSSPQLMAFGMWNTAVKRPLSFCIHEFETSTCRYLFHFRISVARWCRSSISRWNIPSSAWFF